MTSEPVLHLTVGLPGAGKTTLARQIASYGPVPDPPAGAESWFDWASARWPTLPRLDHE